MKTPIEKTSKSKRADQAKAAKRKKKKGAKPKARKEHPQVKVKRTPLGKGVFARNSFSPEDVIGEIDGEIMETGHTSDYCMDLDGKALLEPSWPFRFLNHSCEPNCELMLWKHRRVGGKKVYRMWLLAIGEIEKGQEMTIDYGWPAEQALRCLCGADSCRGWVVDAGLLDEIEA